MLEDKEIRKVAASIVKEAKRTANYDQGTLFRSISYTYIKGVLTFRQIFYGKFNDNSQLEKLARRKVPRGVSYQIIFTDFDRSIESKSRKKVGTASKKSSLSTILKATTINIRALIVRNKLKKKKEAENGEKK